MGRDVVFILWKWHLSVFSHWKAVIFAVSEQELQGTPLGQYACGTEAGGLQLTFLSTGHFPVPFLHFCPVTHTFSARSFSVFIIIIKGSDSKPTQCRSFHWLQKGLDQVQTIFWISGEICSEILQTSKQLLEAKVKLYISY